MQAICKNISKFESMSKRHLLSGDNSAFFFVFCDVCGERVSVVENEGCCPACWKWGFNIAFDYDRPTAYWPI